MTGHTREPSRNMNTRARVAPPRSAASAQRRFEERRAAHCSFIKFGAGSAPDGYQTSICRLDGDLALVIRYVPRPPGTIACFLYKEWKKGRKSINATAPCAGTGKQ